MSEWWVAEYWRLNHVLLGSWVVWVIGSIVLHELGHGFAAIRRGDRTPIETGHITWNPMVHMGGISLACFALFGFTWGAMPVNPSRMRGRHAEAFVAAAGPAVNLSLALVCILGDSLWLRFGANLGAPLHVLENVHTFLWTGSMINVMGVMFNLLPVPPLDGSRILGDFIPAFDRAIHTEKGAIVGLLVAALLFSAGSRKIWAATFFVADESTKQVTALLGGQWMDPIH